MTRLVVRSHKGSGPVTKGQIRCVVDKLPFEVPFTINGVARTYGFGGAGVEREFMRRVDLDEMYTLEVPELRPMSPQEAYSAPTLPIEGVRETLFIKRRQSEVGAPKVKR